jgi:hypothetical protein
VREVYHSALHDELDVRGELQEYWADGSVVFASDLTRGIEPRYRRAEAVYSEPAWKDGYAKFAERAGADTDPTYAGYLRYLHSIRSVIYELGIPAYIVMGKHMLKYLKPDRTLPIMLHGYECLLGIYNTTEDPIGRTNDDVLAWVADRYDCVLDFSCGYGNVARAMRQRDKHFICSDINPKCVYYVAREVMGYQE